MRRFTLLDGRQTPGIPPRIDGDVIQPEGVLEQATCEGPDVGDGLRTKTLIGKGCQIAGRMVGLVVTEITACEDSREILTPDRFVSAQRRRLGRLLDVGR